MSSPPTGGFAALVPEFDVLDVEASLRFWRDILGFRVVYDRAERGFFYLERGKAQVMLNKSKGTWQTGVLERPLGRGVNFQMFVDRIAPILEGLKRAGWPLFEDVQENWYRIGDQEGGNREFLVQDPDGYLLRFAENPGLRPAAR
jgi:catechol 2,3-dioxygenase-like lactoylglutathione lyase family enzyme